MLRLRVRMRVTLALVSTLLGGLCLVAGCSSDDRAATSVDRTLPGDGGPVGTDGSVVGTTPPDTTPTPLTSDPSKCPSGFTDALDEGHHAGFVSAGQERSFDLLLPSSSFDGPRPLVFAFHGTGMSGAGAISDYRLAQWVDAGFVVVAPDSNGNGSVWPVWDALTLPTDPAHTNADLALFDDLLACVAGHYAVDAKRLYVLGQSAGGAMTNFMLSHRSTVLAGGIPASGAFDLTQPNPPLPIDPVTVIVTWGGSNDVYTGAAGNATIADIGYAEQAALASQFWEAQPGSHQIACRGAEVGHVWLAPINEWMRDVLLAHPKGAAAQSGWTLPPLPANAKASCSEDAATYAPPMTVSCPAATTAGCQQYCQMLGDCLVENGTLGPVVAEQVADLGYAKTANVCTGCVAACEADARGSSADKTALGCFATAAPATKCGPGFAGADVFGTVGKCCAQSGSKVCARFCATFEDSELFAPLLSFCP